MTPADPVKAERLRNPVRDALRQTGLYHSIRLPSGEILTGANSLEWQEQRLNAFGLPADLTGKRVLDIGPWDGYYTFEMERRGASVTAIDYVDLDTFRTLHRAFSSQAAYLRLDVYELDPAIHGQFDIVLCLGVLYHLKHPLLAMEKICAVTSGVCVFDTFVVDGEARLQGIQPPMPYAEFYEGIELAGQVDNWCGPTVSAVEAWIRAAGFARAEVLRVTNTTATVAAHRHWPDFPPGAEPPVAVFALTVHQNRGRSFHSAKEHYIELWCEWSHPELPEQAQVWPEVDGLGVAPMSIGPAVGGLKVSFRLPPGLAPGPHIARVKIANLNWSAPSTFFVDLPPAANPVTVASVQDGIAWTTDRIDWANGGWVTIWAAGLSAEADPGNTTVLLSGIPHDLEHVIPATGQINLQLRPVIRPGAHSLAIRHRGVIGPAHAIAVLGMPPPIQGLESLTG